MLLFKHHCCLTSCATLINEGLSLFSVKKKLKIIFDRTIKSPTGYLVSVNTKNKKKAFPDVMQALNKLASSTARLFSSCLETAKFYKWKIDREWKVCENFTICKANQKNVGKAAKLSSNIPGEQLYIDNSCVKAVNLEFWCQLVDKTVKMK